MFLFIIVLAILIINLYSRIGKLEEQLKGMKGQVIVKTSDTEPQTIPLVVPVAPPHVESIQQPTPRTDLSEPKEKGEFLWAKYLARAGIFAILLGFAFLLKLAIDYGWIGIWGRIVLGLVVGFGGVILGQVLRPKYKAYSEVLMGGGISVIYLTIFAAHHFYQLISSSAALGAMVGITALCIIMSILDRAPTIARIGIVGGFLAPLLISTDGMTPTELFTYILILNVGVLAVSLKERWYKLNYIAFIGTFVLYNTAVHLGVFEQYRIISLFFLTIYFLLFLAVSVMHHLVRKEKTTELDIVFIALNALWFGLTSYSIINTFAADYLGLFMLGVSIIYAGVALAAFAGDREDRMLNIFLTSLSVAFLTVAVPMQFDGSWITSIWFIEAIILFAIDQSLKGKNLYPLGLIVFMLGLCKFFAVDNFIQVDYATYQSITNSRFLMLAFITITAAILAVISHKAAITLKTTNDPDVLKGIHPIDLENLKKISVALFIVMNCLALYTLTSEINHHYNQKVIVENNIARAEMAANASGNNASMYQRHAGKVQSLRNTQNTVVSITWAIYASILLALGFSRKSKILRIAGLALIFLTLIKVFLAIWSVGGIYRVISSIVIGVIALVGSFLYAKYANRIKDAINN